MATVTYHIYSLNNDDPQRAEAQDLCCEEGTATIDDEWQQAAPRSNRHAAPQFVTVSYDEWCSGTSLSENSERDNSKASLGTSVSRWYRSLTSTNGGGIGSLFRNSWKFLVTLSIRARFVVCTRTKFRFYLAYTMADIQRTISLACFRVLRVAWRKMERTERAGVCGSVVNHSFTIHSCRRRRNTRRP